MKSRFLLLYLIAFNLDIIYSHKCIHDKIMKNHQPELVFLEYAHHFKQAQSKLERQQIRIYPDFSFLYENIKPEQKQKYQKQFQLIENDLIPLAIYYLEKRLKVYPLSKLYIPQTSEKCFYSKINQKHKTEGVDADLLIYVTTTFDEDDTTLAWAGSCFLNSQDFNRPIAGQLNVNLPFEIDNLEKFDEQLITIIHEITHILGFSNSLYMKFVDENGNVRGKENVIKSIFLRGQQRNIIATPEVVKVSRKHFKCDSLKGMELENEGGDGSSGSHWERMIMNNEAMTASGLQDAVYSKFTLALLKDTGWYDVDYDKATPFYFGKSKGCEFINAPCDNKQFREFCPMNNPKQTCDSFYDARGYCMQDVFSKSEKCKYRISYKNGFCKEVKNTRQQAEIFGQLYGQRSKCFLGNVIKQGFQNILQSGCYESNCENNKVNVIISGQKYVCQKDGEKIDMPKSSGFSGYIICPNYEYFCANYYPKCPNFCSGKGYCHDGKCECRPGYTGDDCSNISGCYNNCNGHGECLINGICRCNSNWYGNDCQYQQGYSRYYSQNYAINKQTNLKRVNRQSATCPDNCNDRGLCNQGICICNEGWTGPACSEKLCIDNCNNNGVCVNGICKCNKDWSGKDCATSMQKSIISKNNTIEKCYNNCNGNGKCINQQCKCKKGWHGNDCSYQIGIKKCPDNCSNNGECYKESGICQCFEGFTGPNCSIVINNKIQGQNLIDK